MKYDDITKAIGSIKLINHRVEWEDFITHSRYPYTYAWDFVRNHQEHFFPDAWGDMSRAEVAWAIQKDNDPQEQRIIAEALAGAFWIEHYS